MITKRDVRSKRILRDPLNREELVYMLAERLRKKDTPGRLYKSSTENRSFLIEINLLLWKRVKTNHS